MMKKNSVLLMLFVLIGLNFFGIYILEFPFYQEILIVSTVSIIIFSLIPEKYVFIAAINLILSYGLFLVIHAVVNNITTIYYQVQYLYSHLLFTSIILMCWLLLNYIKKMGEENQKLRMENNSLQKYKPGQNILTIPGFNEQALWIIADSKINQTEPWFMEVKVTNKYPRVKKQIQKTLEEAAQSFVRKHYDLITSVDGRIYILLKNASQNYVNEISELYFIKIKEKFNLLEPPIFIETAIMKEEFLPITIKGRAK